MVVDTVVSGTLPVEAAETTAIGRMEFQKVQYDLLLSGDSLQMSRQSYPTTARSLEHFLQWRGMGLQRQEQTLEVDAVRAAADKWGLNEYDIPIPQFLDLYLVRWVSQSEPALP